jgi:hypothetical protein
MKGLLIVTLVIVGIAIGILYFALGAEDRACTSKGGHIEVNKEPTTSCYVTRVGRVCNPSFNVTSTCIGAHE